MASDMPLTTGSIVKIYRNNRGHDYVVAGVNRNFSKAYLIKNTCINNNGAVHAAVSDVHKTLDISNDIDDSKCVPGVVRVVGHRDFNTRGLARWSRMVANRRMIKLKEEDAIFPPYGIVDARQSVTV